MWLDQQRAVPPLRIAVGFQVRRAMSPAGRTRRNKGLGRLHRPQHGEGEGRQCVPLLLEGREARLGADACAGGCALARRAGRALAGRRRLIVVGAILRLVLRVVTRLILTRLFRWSFVRSRFADTAAAAGVRFSRRDMFSGTRPARERRGLAAAHRRDHADKQGDQDAKQGMTHGTYEYIGWSRSGFTRHSASGNMFEDYQNSVIAVRFAVKDH